MQILRYGQGEKYEPHFDYIRGRQASARGGHRIATVLMYLSNVKMGGETVFPDAEVFYTFWPRLILLQNFITIYLLPTG